jgi:pyruvate-ferredoxin/flavodoxin oxidoreductase
MKLFARKQPVESAPAIRYPGVRTAMDGSSAVVEMETAASEGAGAYPITPSTQMGEGWALAVAQGQTNVNGRRLLFFEPEGEHAAAAVTAGMSMTGLRATNFSSGQGIAYMHESLYAAVGKRLTYVLNVAARAITKHALNVHAGHDDYHAVDDTGFFQVFAKDVQETADLTLISHRIAELSLNPGICAQDGFLTSHVIETLLLPERELVKEYLGDPADLIDSPTPAQKLVFGPQRRRIPELFDVDYPAMLGTVQNQDSYAQGVAAQRPFYFDHLAELADRAFGEFESLTGRTYARATGYRVDDADYVIAGQGSVVANAQAVADYLREARGLRVGVLNLTMFRPFPVDLVSRLLAGKKGVVVLERTDQPLAVDLPLLREIRAAMSKALENGRARTREAVAALPYPGVAAITADQVPDFYSGCFGLGSRDLQPGDLIAAVENMLPGHQGRRLFYLGIDFVRKGTRLPKLQIWQEQLLDAYPDIATLSLPPADATNLLPKGSLAFRIHSVGGWGAITMGKNVAMTAFEMFGLHVKANPKYGSEKKGQPTTFYGVLASEPVRLNGELKNVDIVLSPDANVFRHSNPLAGLAEGGVFVIQSDRDPEEFWATLPAAARRTILNKRIRVYCLDAFGIASSEASDAELRYRMQGNAFMGAFFALSPLSGGEAALKGAQAALKGCATGSAGNQSPVAQPFRAASDLENVFGGIKKQLTKKFKHLGERAIDDNLRVIRRGAAELRPLETAGLEVGEPASRPLPAMPSLMDVHAKESGVAQPGRFWEQVCFLCKQGQDGLADPFAAVSAMPAASSAIRDMTDVRFEVPQFLADKCTGCAQCWTQCPDSAIPGLVNTTEEIINTAIAAAGESRPVDRLKGIAKGLAREAHALIAAEPSVNLGDVLTRAYATVTAKLGWDPDRRAELDAQFAPVRAALAAFPVAKTRPFFDLPEGKAKGSGGLLSVTVNPETCKGCNLCVEVCPDGALVAVKQTDPMVEGLRANWDFWKKLPDTADRYINVSNLDEATGTLSSLLLKKDNYLAMVGGDGACMGCGEKTVVHLVVSTIQAAMQPRVATFVAKLEALITGLDAKARELLSADADLEQAARAAKGHVDIPMSAGNQQRLERITALLKQLKDLKWRYEEGPGGRGRAALGMANSTGCSSVWASTYPYNPYPFPWTNHLFQDAPSIAIGIFEGQMRKMADNFLAVRRGELELAGEYDPTESEKAFVSFTYKDFTDEEFLLCPPIVAMGGDGAMLDIGFQNLSRLLASGKPLRVVVLDTQVYSNTGGQACTSGFTGQVADMSPYGRAQHGKTEVRKELGLLAIAHRGAYVHQSSQASASHLVSGVIKGLQTRRPAIFNLYTPCPIEHGLADDWSRQASRLALESRAFPYLTYDPDAGPTFSDCLSLEGNPSLEDLWPTYSLKYETDDGVESTMELPLTIADWAATEGRFKKHFKEVPQDQWTDDMVPFHEFLDLAPADRDGKVPFIYTLRGKKLSRMSVSGEMVALAEERRLFWSQLKQLAGLEVSEAVRERIASVFEREYEQKAAAITAEYERQIADLKANYAHVVARRLAEGLIKVAEGKTVGDLVSTALAAPYAAPAGSPDLKVGPAVAPAGVAVLDAPVAAAVSSTVATPVGPTFRSGEQGDPAVSAPESDALVMEPYIDSALCTSCNECTNISKKLFAYNENKQAYIKDPRGGTFQQLVKAAELCPVRIIHPGTPLNPKEKDLDKWIARAAAFN